MSKMSERLKIVFMGTPEFALEVLKKLYESDDELIAVVTQPDKPKGRGQKLLPSPVKEFALEKNLRIFQPERAKDEAFIQEIKSLSPDLVVVCAYGQILPKELLEIPELGSINVHASLLPKYRGASPIARAILAGEKETGITIMKMTEELDAGPILLQKSIPIKDDDTTGTLEKKLSQLGGELLLEAIKGLKAGTINPIPQDDSKASYAPVIKKEEARINWSEPAELIWRKVRAFNPKPGAYVGEGNNLIKIWKAEPGEQAGEPGVVLEAHNRWIEVACGEGSLRILELQPAGKKPMTSQAFLAGHRLKAGEPFSL